MKVRYYYVIHIITSPFSFHQIKSTLDEFLEKLPEEFNMYEMLGKVPVEERTPYVTVALQESERMNTLTNEIRRSLKELNLGLKVSRLCLYGLSAYLYSHSLVIYVRKQVAAVTISFRKTFLIPIFSS